MYLASGDSFFGKGLVGAQLQPGEVRVLPRPETVVPPEATRACCDQQLQTRCRPGEAGAFHAGMRLSVESHAVHHSEDVDSVGDCEAVT